MTYPFPTILLFRAKLQLELDNNRFETPRSLELARTQRKAADNEAHADFRKAYRIARSVTFFCCQ